jgi:hypothetical protein
VNILGQMFRDIHESNLGRIRWHPNMWAIIGSRWDRKRIRNTSMIGSSRVNADGEFIDGNRTLVHRVHARCPKAPGDDFYFDDKWYWVPATECRKCQYHRVATRRHRFPCCTFGRGTVSDAAKKSLIQIGEMVGKATAQAQEMMGGKI